MLRANDINRINEANLVLRHFVDLSAYLLPFLSHLQTKKSLTEEDLKNKEKIISVFDGYQFETKTSEYLFNSNILELIKTTYAKITNSKNEKNHQRKILRQFLNEHKRLVNSWEYIESN